MPAPHVCGRCGSRQVRDLGDAGSNLRWFACLTCCYVWGVDEHDEDPAPPSDSWRFGRPLRARN